MTDNPDEPTTPEEDALAASAPADLSDDAADEAAPAEDQQDLAPTESRLDQVELQDEIQRSFLDYAMYVIVDRALPDVRDGLKPVHRRVLYGMYDGGYRPDRGWNKCSRIVGDVMGKYHPHGDTAIYDTLVRMAQPWVMRHPLISGQGNFGSPGNDGAAAMRYTECKMHPLSMEMVRDIDENTVDMKPNYDNKDVEPVVLPARYPNLLVNGSTGIAVGMATNIPTHNMREVAEAVYWALEHPESSDEELLEAAIARVKGPDFPNGALIVGRQGIEDAYRTGRGSVTMRAVINIEEDKQGRQSLVVTELPYMCNPDNLAAKIADLVNTGRLQGISNMRDDTSARTGQRLVIELKRDAVARVVMNNLYKHTTLQDNFGCNMLALVDGVPRTLRLDQFISYWVTHQLEVIRRRTQYRLDKAEERAHLDRGLVLALDRLDEVIALIRASRTADAARENLKELLGVDDAQAVWILDQQLRRLASMEIRAIEERLARLEVIIADLKEILASDERQRRIVADELREIVDKYGDERRTQIIRADGDMSDEDFIPDEDVVVTITHGGYAKRTRADQYRVQRRGGKGVRGAKLRADDEVQHLFTTSNHQWILFFTNFGRVYRIKAWQLPEGGRDARGGHVAGLLSFLPEERIAQVLSIRSYTDAPYLLLATRNGLVKKSALGLYDTPRQAGVIAVSFREDDDELIGAALCGPQDDVLLISRKAQSIRFQASDEQLRPTGRNTSGVTGMRFREGDSLLSMSIIEAGTAEDEQYVFTVTDAGYAKRSRVSEYRQQSRSGIGIKAMKIDQDNRGMLVGALVVAEGDQVIAMKASGQIVRSSVAEVAVKGRDTMGVRFVGIKGDDSVATIALNPEAEVGDETGAPERVEGVDAVDDEGVGDEEGVESSATVDQSTDGEMPAEETRQEDDGE